MKKVKITHHFSTVLEALEASNIDIAYNPESARQKAKACDQSNRYTKATGKVFLCEDGKIRFLVKCFDGLMVLNTFTPFMAVMDDSSFTLALIKENEIEIHTSLQFPKSMRKEVIKLVPFVVV